MKRAWLIVCCGALSACFPFDQRVDELCDAGFLTGCPTGDDAGADGGDLDAGNDAGTFDAGDDAGIADAGDDAGITDAGDDAGVADAGMNDAGSTDAGVPDAGPPFTFDGGAYCKGVWCWENPSAVPGVNLDAIWGTSSTDVWVAGGSGVVAHFDGTGWSPAPFFQQLGGDTELWTAATDSQGRVYFCGNGMAAIGFGSDGTVITPGFSNQTACSGVDWWNQSTLFVSYGASQTSYLLPDEGAPMSVTLPSDITDIYTHVRARLDDDGTVAVIEYGANGYSIARDDLRTFMRRDDGGVVPYITSLRRDPRGTLRALAFDSDSNSAMGAWDDANQRWAAIDRTDGGRLWDMAPEALSDGGTLWFYVGANGYLGFSSENGRTQQLSGIDYQYGDLYGAWRAPGDGAFWAVGEGGQVFRTSRLPDGGFGPRTVMTQQMQQTIQDLWVAGPTKYAAGDNGTVWTKGVDGGWSWTSGFNGAHIISYVRTSQGSVTLHEDATVRLGSGAIIGAALPSLPTLYTRNGALAVMPDGGVIVAWGDRTYRATNFTSLDMLPSQSAFSHATDLVVEPSGVMWAGGISGADSSNINGGISRFTEGTFSNPTLYSGQPVYAVSLATDGGVFALGQQDVLRCDASGCVPLTSTGAYQPVSLWVDAQNRVWVLNQKGQVCWGDATQGLTCDPPFWSGGDYIARLPLRIRGDASRVYVVGAYGGIISRPLPP